MPLPCWYQEYCCMLGYECARRPWTWDCLAHLWAKIQTATGLSLWATPREIKVDILDLVCLFVFWHSIMVGHKPTAPSLCLQSVTFGKACVAPLKSLVSTPGKPLSWGHCDFPNCVHACKQTYLEKEATGPLLLLPMCLCPCSRKGSFVSYSVTFQNHFNLRKPACRCVSLADTRALALEIAS